MIDKNKQAKETIEAAKKMLDAKKDILAYSNGEISKTELNGRGVKLAMPL